MQSEIKIGPWPGGLNTRDLASEIADNEVCEAENVIFDNDGVAYARPPVVEVAENIVALTGDAGPFAWNALLFLDRGVTQNKEVFVYCAVDIASGDTFIVYKNVFTGQNPSGSWVKAVSTTPLSIAKPTSAVYYKGIIYCTSNTVNGGYSFPEAFVTSIQTATLNANIPQGNFSEIIKERMFVVNRNIGGRISWSKATDPTIWAAPDGGFITAIDGGSVKDVLVLGETLYIFKDTGIWTFSFNEDPALDGVYKQISRQAVVSATLHENHIFVFTGQMIAEFVNNNFYNLSDKLSFIPDLTHVREVFYSVARLSVVGDFLILWNVGNTQPESIAYVMNLQSGAWSIWKPAYAGNLILNNWPGGYGSIAGFGFVGRMLNNTNKEVLMGVGSWYFSQNPVVVDMSYIFKNFKSPSATALDQDLAYGPIDRSGPAGSYVYGSLANIVLTTKNFGFNNQGKWKKLRYLRSLHQAARRTSHSHKFNWFTIVDEQAQDPVGTVSTSANLPDDPEFVPMVMSRFRRIQFKFLGTTNGSTPSNTIKSWVEVSGLEAGVTLPENPRNE